MYSTILIIPFHLSLSLSLSPPPPPAHTPHRHPQLNSELDITTSQSTTENEDYEGEEKPRLFSQEAAARSGRQPLDPALLEALCLAATANLAQEEEALGNVLLY